MTIPTYTRRCPACGNLNNPEVLRCTCGNLLTGVDLTVEQERSLPETPAPVHAPDSGAILCPFPDCAQSNPAGSTQCRYCDRPLSDCRSSSSGLRPGTSLINLPGALAARYRITEAMPAKGAEAELLLVQALGGGDTLVAKIYRHGILPKTAVQERIAKIAKDHRVDIIEFGVSDGYAYELMEYCSGGSLRSLLQQPAYLQGMPGDLVRTITRELALALEDIHVNGLIHRDLKPENILVRATQPLDLVLTDFGIASILDVTQRYTGVAHTLPYAAPESLSGVIDAKADYWALGMIILEAATGTHPFRDLSDAVILHYLTTRNIVTSDIRDTQTGKLVRGLLVRDPARRWGAAELQRWLSGDQTLPEPVQNHPETEQPYGQPYHLGEQRCYQPEQLGVALAHQWELGIADIHNGQLLSWFRDVQKDQNAVRMLIEQRSNPTTSIDLQLLTLILHLAPGIPPVWRGNSIALPAIFTLVSAAIRGDTKAVDRLNELYQYRVLEIYAKAGNQGAADIVQRWNKTCDQFAATWEAKNALLKNRSAAPGAVHEPVNIDQLMYGNDRLHRPYLSTMHARILAFCYDSNWAQKKRQSIGAELTRLSVQCPWFVELGDPLIMSPVEVLVTECLLPELRSSAEKQHRQASGSRLQLEQECQATGNTVTGIINQLRTSLNHNSLTPEHCQDLLELCSEYFSAIATVRASGRTDAGWMEMRKSALRYESRLHVLIDKLNRLTEHQATNSGWFNPTTVGYALFLLVILFLPSRRSGSTSLLPGTAMTAGVLVLTAAFLLWRFMPVYLWKQQIREIACRL